MPHSIQLHHFRRTSVYWAIVITLLVVALCLSQKIMAIDSVGAIGVTQYESTEQSGEHAETLLKKKAGQCQLTKQLITLDLPLLPVSLLARDVLPMNGFIQRVSRAISPPFLSGQIASLRRHLKYCVFHE